MNRNNPNFQNNVLIGGILIIIGTLLFLQKTLHLSDYISGWAVVFIAAGCYKVYTSQTSTGYLIGGGLVIWGVILNLNHLHILNFHLRDIWPLFLVAAGASIILRGRKFGPDLVAHNATNHDFVSSSAIMAGSELSCDSQNFLGGEVSAIMGGVEIDLRNASIQAEEAVINVTAFWGGIEIRVPNDWTVINKVVPLLGGASDGTRPTPGASKRLVLTGTAIMGGIEVKN